MSAQKTWIFPSFALKEMLKTCKTLFSRGAEPVTVEMYFRKRFVEESSTKTKKPSSALVSVPALRNALKTEQQMFNYTQRQVTAPSSTEAPRMSRSLSSQSFLKPFLLLLPVGFVLFHFQFGWVWGCGLFFFYNWKKWNVEWKLSLVQNSNTKQNYWLL